MEIKHTQCLDFIIHALHHDKCRVFVNRKAYKMEYLLSFTIISLLGTQHTRVPDGFDMDISRVRIQINELGLGIQHYD